MIENFQKAENMLNQVTAIQRLINRLQSILAAPVNPYRVTLDNETKATIQSFRAEVQDHIDELSAQREKVLALVQQIQDGELRALLIMRYGLAEKCTEKKNRVVQAGRNHALWEQNTF